MSLQKTAVVVFLTLFVFSLSNCISNQQCEHGYLCVQKSGIGICEKIPGTIELNTEIGVSGPFLTDQELNERKKDINPEEVMKEVYGRCGNEDFPYLPREEYKKNANPLFDPPCGSTKACDYASKRDTYTTTSNEVFRVTWLVFNCSSTGNWKDIAPSKIAEAHTLLNQIYLPIGYQFTYEIRYFPCNGTSGTRDYSSMDTPLVVTAVQTEIGTNFQTLGKLVVVSGKPVDSTLNGFFYLPGGSYSGIGFMNSLRIGVGYTTLQHELGHGFGLQHTFAGVSELSNCNCPEVNATDDAGDFCSDTPPVARNWECVSTISTTTYPDPCTARGPNWLNNPYTNLMSYGNCRTSFTPQQIRRVRCYEDVSLKWLKDDKCFGKVSNDPTVCSGNGICTTTNTCNCNFGWTGSNCNVTMTCFGKNSTDPEVCNFRNGTCIGQNNCSCTTGWSGSQCTQFSCFGISPTNSSVCSSRGNCTYLNTCQCNSGWAGSQCNQIGCFGKVQSDPTVCNGNGACLRSNNCTCNTGWSGSQCSQFTCYGISPSNSSVCSGKGTCTGPNTCNCNPGWVGSQCSDFTCDGKLPSDSSVCSGRGVCSGLNQCTCQSPYSGYSCQFSTCYGKNSSDVTVCSRRGVCDSGICICNSGFFGTQCENFTCFELNSTNPNICSGRGNCTALNTCECNSFSFGQNCSMIQCSGKNYTNINSCDQVAPNDSSNNNWYYLLFIPAGVLTGVVALGGIGAVLIYAIKSKGSTGTYELKDGIN